MGLTSSYESVNRGVKYRHAIGIEKRVAGCYPSVIYFKDYFIRYLTMIPKILALATAWVRLLTPNLL